MQAEGEPCAGAGSRWSVTYRPRREGSEEAGPQTPWSRTPSLHDCEKINLSFQPPVWCFEWQPSTPARWPSSS